MALTLADIEKAHPVFFSPETMRFWGSRIHRATATAYKSGLFFVTSEHNFDRSERRYTLRLANLQQIDTVGDFNGYATLSEAKRAMRRLTAN